MELPQAYTVPATDVSKFYDPIRTATELDAMQEGRYRNRLTAMAMQDEERKRKDLNALTQMMMAGQPGSQPQLGAQPIQPQQPATGNALTGNANRPAVQLKPESPASTGNALTGTATNIPENADTNATRQPTFMDRYTAQVTSRMPSPDQVWAAAKSGQISAQGAYEYQQQYATQLASAEDSAFKDFTKFYEPIAKTAIETGNNEAFQAVLKAGMESGIPKLQRISETALKSNIQVTGKGETKTELEVTPQYKEILTRQTTDPLILKAVQDFPEGQTASIAMKGGKVVEFKPVTKSISAEELQRRALRKQMGREPSDQEVIDAMDARDMKKAREKRLIVVNNPMPSRVKGGRGGGSGGSGGGSPTPGVSFRTWDGETKRIAFEDYKATGKIPDFGGKWKNGADYKQFTAEYYKWRKTGKIDTSDVMDERANIKSLNDLAKRETLIGTFTHRIDATSDVVIKLAQKYRNTNSRLLNIPINSLSGMMGSGDLQALKLALKSLSNEVAKVESGSLGIAEVSVEQSKYMERVHDPNLSLNDMLKVINTGKALGKTNMDSIRKQRQELKGRIQSGGEGEGRGSGSGNGSNGIPRYNSAVNRVKTYMSGHWNNDKYSQSMWRTLKSAGYSDAQALKIYDDAKGGQ